MQMVSHLFTISVCSPLVSVCSSFWPQTPAFFSGGLPSGYCIHFACTLERLCRQLECPGAYLSCRGPWPMRDWCRLIEAHLLCLVHSRLPMQDQAEAILCETLKYYPHLASSPSLSCFPPSLSSLFWEYFPNANPISRFASRELKTQRFSSPFSWNSNSNLSMVER